MRSPLLVAFLVLPLLLSGCCQSFQPWVSTEATTKVEGLPGKWRAAEDSRNVFKAKLLKDGSYSITGWNKGPEIFLRAGKVGKITVADISGKLPSDSFALPCHMLIRFELNGSVLRTYSPDTDQLIAVAKRKKATVVTLNESGFPTHVISAPGRKDLFEIVKAYVTSGGKWKENATYSRK